jgi:hypothetical protein
MVDINSLPGPEGILTLCDLTGKILSVKKIYEPGHYEFDPEIKNSIYIASFLSGTRRSSKKIFIANR